jgi:hypothetical protein
MAKFAEDNGLSLNDRTFIRVEGFNTQELALAREL